MDSNLKTLTEFVPWAIVNDRQKIIELLTAATILVDSKHISNSKLTKVVMNNLFDTPKFRDLFYTYLKSKVSSTSFSNADGFFSGTSFGDVAGLVTSGLGLLGATQVSKDQKAAAIATAQSNLALAQAQVSSNQLALQTAQLQLQAAQAKPASNSTMIYVGLAVFGLVAIGAVVYAVTKK